LLEAVEVTEMIKMWVGAVVAVRAATATLLAVKLQEVAHLQNHR